MPSSNRPLAEPDPEVVPPPPALQLKDRPHISVDVQQQVFASFLSLNTGSVYMPAKMVEEYEKAVPGGGKWALAAADSQRTHRQQLETNQQRTNDRLALRAQTMAFTIGVTGIISGVVLIASGRSVEGTILGTGTLVSLVGAFFKGTGNLLNSRQAKRNSISSEIEQNPPSNPIPPQS